MTQHDEQTAIVNDSARRLAELLKYRQRLQFGLRYEHDLEALEEIDAIDAEIRACQQELA